MIFLCVPLCILFSMLGGQINKLFRPIGVTLSIIGIYSIWNLHTIYLSSPVLLYGVFLSLGYGEDSKLFKWLKDDELVRDFYSSACCIPPIIICIINHNWLSIVGCIGIVIAYQLRERSWGKIGKYDILPDDLFRGLAIGLAVSLALI